MLTSTSTGEESSLAGTIKYLCEAGWKGHVRAGVACMASQVHARLYETVSNAPGMHSVCGGSEGLIDCGVSEVSAAFSCIGMQRGGSLDYPGASGSVRCIRMPQPQQHAGSLSCRPSC